MPPPQLAALMGMMRPQGPPGAAPMGPPPPPPPNPGMAPPMPPGPMGPPMMVNPLQRGSQDQLSSLLEQANNLLQQFVMNADAADERVEGVSQLQQKIVEMLTTPKMGAIPPGKPQGNNMEMPPPDDAGDDYDLHSIPGIRKDAVGGMHSAPSIFPRA